ncbi:MAG: PA2169 family four-helix-bundle protein [Flavobacteriales bacterium]
MSTLFGKKGADRSGPEFVYAGANDQAMNRDAQLREMNDIYQLMADGRKGYKEAADRAKDERLSGLLTRLSQQRESMENELGAEIRRFKPDDHTQEGTLKGVLHRTWMDIRTALGTADDSTVLDECERGERYLLDRLNAVIGQEPIAPTSRNLLMGQRGMVEQNLAQVEQLLSEFRSVDK